MLAFYEGFYSIKRRKKHKIHPVQNHRKHDDSHWVNVGSVFGYMTTRLRNVLIPKIKNATIVTLNPNMIHGMARVESAWP